MIQITILLKYIIIINVIHPMSYLKIANNLNFQSEKYKLVNSDKYQKPANVCLQNKKTHYNEVSLDGSVTH